MFKGRRPKKLKYPCEIPKSSKFYWGCYLDITSSQCVTFYYPRLSQSQLCSPASEAIHRPSPCCCSSACWMLNKNVGQSDTPGKTRLKSRICFHLSCQAILCLLFSLIYIPAALLELLKTSVENGCRGGFESPPPCPWSWWWPAWGGTLAQYHNVLT